MKARVKKLNLLFKNILSLTINLIGIIRFADGNFAFQNVRSEETAMDHRRYWPASRPFYFFLWPDCSA